MGMTLLCESHFNNGLVLFKKKRKESMKMSSSAQARLRDATQSSLLTSPLSLNG